MKKKTLSRRKFIGGLVALPVLSSPLIACDNRHFVRPGKQFDMGVVRSLLHPQLHISEKQLLLYRDAEGWSVMSTRCTYDGCDLTFQTDQLLCSCCGSEYSHKGEVFKGPTSHNLPWYEIFYKKTHLYADSAKVVSPSYRFTTPEIERALEQIGVKIRSKEIKPPSEIPEILLGQGDEIINEVEAFDVELDSLDDQELFNRTKEALKAR